MLEPLYMRSPFSLSLSLSLPFGGDGNKTIDNAAGLHGEPFLSAAHSTMANHQSCFPSIRSPFFLFNCFHELNVMDDGECAGCAAALPSRAAACRITWLKEILVCCRRPIEMMLLIAICVLYIIRFSLSLYRIVGVLYVMRWLLLCVEMNAGADGRPFQRAQI